MQIKVDKKELAGLDHINECIDKALAKAVLVIEAQAKQNLYNYGDMGDHGEVARSIYSGTEGHEAYVSVGAEAGYWYEYGTGKFAEFHNGRPGWWVYVDDDYPHKKSTVRKIYTEQEADECMAWLIAGGVPADKVHKTEGSEARPFLRPALHTSKNEFKQTLAKGIKEAIIDAKR